MRPNHTFVLIDHCYLQRSLSQSSRLFKRKLFCFIKNPIGLGAFSYFIRSPSKENNYEIVLRKASEPNCRPNANEKFDFESKGPNKTRVLHWSRQFAEWFRTVMNDVLKRGCYMTHVTCVTWESLWVTMCDIHEHRDSPSEDHFWFWETEKLSKL